MIKLKHIISEIRIIAKVTPEQVNKKYQFLVHNYNKFSTILGAKTLFANNGYMNGNPLKWLKTLTPDILAKLNKELSYLESTDLNEIRIIPKITPKTIIDLKYKLRGKLSDILIDHGWKYTLTSPTSFLESLSQQQLYQIYSEIQEQLKLQQINEIRIVPSKPYRFFIDFEDDDIQEGILELHDGTGFRGTLDKDSVAVIFWEEEDDSAEDYKKLKEYLDKNRIKYINKEDNILSRVLIPYPQPNFHIVIED